MDMERNTHGVAYSPVPDAESDLPPEYMESISASNGLNESDDIPEEKKEIIEPEKLPSYELATTLPSYEDAQRIEENEVRNDLIKLFFHLDESTNEIYVDGVAVGSDCTFFFAFILAFFFNWLGFFIGYCILLSLSGRYGAMSGFGLSLLNWLMYLKYAQNEAEYFTEEKLLMWWFFFFIGSLLIVKGLVNWMKVRRVLSMTEEEREHGRLLVLY